MDDGTFRTCIRDARKGLVTVPLVGKALLLVVVGGMDVFSIGNIDKCLVRARVVARGLRMRLAMEVLGLLEGLLVEVVLLVKVVKLVVVVVIVLLSRLIVSKIFAPAAERPPAEPSRG